MNYANREAAQALKDAGFDERVGAFYSSFKKNSEVKTAAFFSDYNSAMYNRISAPDFLTAADWIDLKSEGYIQLSFWKTSTVVYNDAIGEQSKVFQIGDHRNAAIIHALQELKKLKDANNSTT
jgi:hypothetical protein